MASDRDSEGDEEFYETDDLSEIHQGIINDDLDLLRQALEAGVDANKKFSAEINPQHEGMTPLALASALNKIEAVKILLTYRANVNDTFASLKTTALMTSSFHGHSEVVRILLKKGADVRAVDLQGSTALGYAFGGARTIDVICQLLKAGVDVNQKNMLGMSALLLVAGYGNDVLAKMILDAGADANAVNDFGHSALHLTVVGKRSQIKKLTSGQTGPYGLNRRNIDVALKEWARLNSDTLRGRDNERELEKVGQFMMNIGSKLDERENINDDDNEAMKRRVEAVWRHRQDKITGEKEKKKPGFVDNFLSCGGKRSKQAKQQRDGKSPTSRPLVPPLDNDAGRYNLPPDVDREIALISDSCSKILRMIIDQGCEIDKMEKTFGMTALDMAILLGDVESTAVLVAAGGDASHLVKMFALTDLYEAMAQNDKKQVKELLTYDTDLDVNQPFSQFNITRRRGTTAGEPDNLKSDGLTPLTVAAQMSEVEVLDIMKMLQKQGADVNRVGPGGSCPIAEACRMGNLKMVQFLVAQGASVETKSPAYKDATPVVIAAMFRHRPVVEFLLSKEAKIDKLMTDGRAALLKAVENDDRAMVETLLNANLLDNFSDRNSFSYSMADTYQRPDRDFDSLMRTMIDEARHLADREREESIRQQGKMPRVQQPPISMAANPMATSKQSNHRRQTALDEPNHHQGAPPPAPGSRGFRGGPEVMVVHDNDVNRQRQKQARPPSPAESSEEEDDDEEDEEDDDDEEEDVGLNQQVPVMQQKPQPKQGKHQPRQPPPPVPPPAHSSSEEEEEEVKVAPPPGKQKGKQPKLIEVQLKQQQPAKQQVQQPKLPPPPVESLSEESEEEEEKKVVIKHIFKQPVGLGLQPQKQQQMQPQKQQKKEDPQVRQPIPPERSSSEEEEDSEEEEEEDETPVVNKQPAQQQQPQIKPQQLQKQPLPTVTKQQQQPKQPPPPAKKPESSEEEDSEEEESEEESEGEPPRVVVSAQLPKQQPPPPQAQAPPPAGSKAPSRPPPVNQAPPPAAKPNVPPSSEEESEEEEETEEEESEEEEEVKGKPLPQQQQPPKSALPVILPSARFENRSLPQVLNTKDPGPKSSSTPARPNNVKPTPNNSKSIPSRAVPAPVQSPMSPPSGPPPPLPSTGPPSDTPSDSDEEEWDEDGDFEEHHVPVGAKDDMSGTPGKKAGTNQSTKTSVTTKVPGGVVTRTVVTKTVVKSGVVKSGGEPLAKGRVNIAKVEESDESEEDDDDDEDDDDEEERGRLHHSTETDI